MEAALNNGKTAGVVVPKELEVAVQRFNIAARRAMQTGMLFTVGTRRSECTGSDISYLDLLAEAPVAGDFSSVQEDYRCEAWTDLVGAASEVNRLLEKADAQNAGIALRIGECAGIDRPGPPIRTSGAARLVEIGLEWRAGAA
jgi:hypothetical protein